MPISLLKTRRAKTADTKTATVEFGDESMTIEYRIGALSPATLQALQDNSADDNERLFATVDFLAEVLGAWEVTDNGATLPIDEATLASLPLDFLSAIANAIVVDVQVPKPSTSGSFTS